MKRRKTLLIVDDHPLFREGLKAIIAQDERFVIVGETGDGEEALALAERLRPDLVLLDISLPGVNGIHLARSFSRMLPSARLLVVSMHSRTDYVIKAFRAGASGYVLKESAAEMLIKGLEAICRGERFLDDSLGVSRDLVESCDDGHATSDTAYGMLTPREQEILRLVAEGLSSRAIGEKLFISPKTVENHRANIMNKLDLHGTVELIRYAARLGVIDVDLWKE